MCMTDIINRDINFMKKLQAAIIGLCLLSLGWAPALLANESAKVQPLDLRECNFRDGKNMEDLKKAAASFRDYANKNDIAYAAWILTPSYYSGDHFDVGWLGAWTDGVSFGVSLERWNQPGNPVAAELGSVIDCRRRHTMMMSLPINAPTDAAPGDGQLLLYKCDLEEGKTVPEAYKAHLDLGLANKALGSLAMSWLYFPVAGAGEIDYDYLYAVGFDRYADVGATMEVYFNQGGAVNRAKILGPYASCGIPDGFDAYNVRAHDER